MVGRVVPFVGTGGVKVLQMTPASVELLLPLSRRVKNHLGGAHAAATALLAETAGGLVFSLNLPCDRVPVVRNMRIDYLRPSKGRQWARAVLPDSDSLAMKNDAEGKIEIPVDIWDEQGGDVVRCELVYAWFTRPPRS